MQDDSLVIHLLVNVHKRNILGQFRSLEQNLDHFDGKQGESLLIHLLVNARKRCILGNSTYWDNFGVLSKDLTILMARKTIHW